MSILSTISDIFTGKSVKAAAGGNLATSTVPIGGPTGIISKIPSYASAAKNVAVAGLGVLVGYGILKENPKAPLQVSKAAVSVGSDIGKFTENPTAKNALEVVKEHPVLTSAAGLALLGVGVKTAGPTIASFMNTAAIKSNTKAALSGPMSQPIESYFPSPVTSSSAGGSPSLPVMPSEDVTTPLQEVQAQSVAPEEMTSQGVTTTKKRKKSRSKPQRQSISQRVDVRVGVNAANKKYIKNEILN